MLDGSGTCVHRPCKWPTSASRRHILSGKVFLSRRTVDSGPSFDSRNTGQASLIVEPNPEGHRLDYVGLFLVESFRSRGQRAVVVTTADAVESTQWDVHLAAIAPEIAIRPAEAFTLKGIASAATDVNAPLTIVPDGDQYLFPILRYGWTGPGRLSVLSMRADGQPKESIWPTRVRGVAKKLVIFGADQRSRVRVSALRSPPC